MLFRSAYCSVASDEEFGIGDLFREEVAEASKGGQTGGNRSVRSRLGMAPGFTRFEVEKFDGTGNFGLWQTRVKDLLAQQGILKGLQETKPAKVDDDTWEDMQVRAAANIRLCLADQVMYHVMDEDSPKGIWDKLASRYMSKSATNKLYLKQKFYGLKMQEGSDLVEHVNAFNQLVTDLARLDVKIEDEDKALLLLVSLPPSYEHLVITLTHGKTTVNNEEITAALLGHELRKQKNAAERDSTQGLGLAVKGYQLRKGQEAEKKKKKKVQCYKCKEWGHIKRECPELKGEASANLSTNGGDSDSSSDALVVSDRRSTKTEAWMLDSACSFHATPNREWFSSYKSGEFGFAYVGDNTGYRVAGIGDIKIKMFDGVERMLRGVRYVPGLRRNLVSLGVLHDGGMEFRCDRDKKTMEIIEDGMTVMIGERTASHLYKLQGSTIAGGVMKSGGVAVESQGGDGSNPPRSEERRVGKEC